MSETTEREANNRRICEWLGKCWHEVMGDRCSKCHAKFAYAFGGGPETVNADYYTPTGCLELIEAVRGKGYEWNIFSEEGGQWEADIVPPTLALITTYADDLPTATVNAVLALIDSLEGK